MPTLARANGSTAVQDVHIREITLDELCPGDDGQVAEVGCGVQGNELRSGDDRKGADDSDDDVPSAVAMSVDSSQRRQAH